jgi:hypothetical protein
VESDKKAINEVVRVISAIALADLNDIDAHEQLDAFIGVSDTTLFEQWFRYALLYMLTTHMHTSAVVQAVQSVYDSDAC